VRVIGFPLVVIDGDLAVRDANGVAKGINGGSR
jgi:hypothetical protein